MIRKTRKDDIFRSGLCIPQGVYRHEPTGAVCTHEGYAFELEAGYPLKLKRCGDTWYDCDIELIEDRVSDGVLMQRHRFYRLDEADFVVTGKVPTQESLLSWKLVSG